MVWNYMHYIYGYNFISSKRIEINNRPLISVDKHIINTYNEYSEYSRIESCITRENH